MHQISLHAGHQLPPRIQVAHILLILCHWCCSKLHILYYFTRNASQDQQDLIAYFICESYGIDLTDPCLLKVDRSGAQAFNTTAYIGVVLGPYAILIFIVPINKIIKKWRNTL